MGLRTQKTTKYVHDGPMTTQHAVSSIAQSYTYLQRRRKSHGSSKCFCSLCKHKWGRSIKLVKLEGKNSTLLQWVAKRTSMLCCFFSCYLMLPVSDSSTKPSSGSMLYSKKAHPLHYLSYNMELRSQLYSYLYRCTVHFVVYLSNTPTNAHRVFNNLKFTLKLLKRSYMFRSHGHPRAAYLVPC